MNIESIKISTKTCFSFCKERVLKLADKKVVKVAAFLFALITTVWVAYSVGRWVIRKLHSNKLKVLNKAMEGVENSARNKADLTIPNGDRGKGAIKESQPCQGELISENEAAHKNEFQESLPHGQEGKINKEEKSKTADEDAYQGEFPEGESGGTELDEDEVDHGKLYDKWKLTDVYTDEFKDDLSDGQDDLAYDEEKSLETDI